MGPGGSCGPVASLGLLIHRYLVPRGRGHTPQVVVEPFASPQRRRRPARSGAAAGGWKGGEGRESWKMSSEFWPLPPVRFRQRAPWPQPLIYDALDHVGGVKRSDNDLWGVSAAARHQISTYYYPQ